MKTIINTCSTAFLFLFISINYATAQNNNIEPKQNFKKNPPSQNSKNNLKQQPPQPVPNPNPKPFPHPNPLPKPDTISQPLITPQQGPKK